MSIYGIFKQVHMNPQIYVHTFMLTSAYTTHNKVHKHTCNTTRMDNITQTHMHTHEGKMTEATES